MLGGAQSLHTNALDEALGASHRGGRASGSAHAANHRPRNRRHQHSRPVGGSHYIEKLTDEIERGAEEYIQRIDAMGGTLAAIENGFIQNEIQNAAYAYQQTVERGETIVVGVNKFQQDQASAPTTFRLDPELERQQIARIRELRASRDARAVDASLCALEDAARSSDNLMPRILTCAEAYATVGEISDRLAPSLANITNASAFCEADVSAPIYRLPSASRSWHRARRAQGPRVRRDIEVMIGNEVGLRIRRNQVLPILDAHPHHQSTNIIPQPRNQFPLHFKRGRSVEVPSSMSSSTSAILRTASKVIAQQFYSLSVHTSVNAARRSACATIASWYDFSPTPVKLGMWSERSSGSPLPSWGWWPILPPPLVGSGRHHSHRHSKLVVRLSNGLVLE